MTISIVKRSNHTAHVSLSCCKAKKLYIQQNKMDEDAKVYVVDDDIHFRKSISRLLGKRGFDVEVYGSAEEFLLAFGAGRPGCIVLDYSLPGMDGIQLQAHLIEEGIDVPIIFITEHGGIPESVKATKAGAIDFLEKRYYPQKLVDCIEVALDLDKSQRKAVKRDFDLKAATLNLTCREKEVLCIMIEKPESSSSKAVAQELGISPRTVDQHRARILIKMKCSSAAELIRRCSTQFQSR